MLSEERAMTSFSQGLPIVHADDTDGNGKHEASLNTAINPCFFRDVIYTLVYELKKEGRHPNYHGSCCKR